jgi:hypothetical protein
MAVNARGGIRLCAIALTIALLLIGGAQSVFAQNATPAAKPPAKLIVKPGEITAQAWQTSLLGNHPTPNSGCYEAVYPSTTWKGISCSTGKTANLITPRKIPVKPSDENSGGDYTISTQNAIYSASGSLPQVENVTSVQGFGAGNTKNCLPGVKTCPVSNEFNLQINTNTGFTGASICGTLKGCFGWMQFVYDSGGSINIQSWGFNFISGCPSGLILTGPQNSCGKRTAVLNLPFSPTLTLPQLAGAVLTGQIYKDSKGNIYDQVSIVIGNTAYTAAPSTEITGAYGQWKTTQFDVYGESAGDESIFNSGSLVSASLNFNNDADDTISCNGPQGGVTGESTNLTLTPCVTNSVPGVSFDEGVVPVIKTITPAAGPTTGQTTVVLTATTGTPNNTPVVNGFDSNALIYFGNNLATKVSCGGATCTVISPATSVAGPVSITAANVFSNGTIGPVSTTSSAATFLYQAVQAGSFSKNCPPGENGVPPN